MGFPRLHPAESAYYGRRNRASFTAFHGPRTQPTRASYQVRLLGSASNTSCSGHAGSAGAYPSAASDIDEYQDLNPIDLQFVDEMIARGVTTFVAGDDDQSIYSFQILSPPEYNSSRKNIRLLVPAPF